MLEETLIQNETEWNQWVQKRREWDHDFDPEGATFPCVVLWNEITSNDWSLVLHRVYFKSSLENLMDKINNLSTL